MSDINSSDLDFKVLLVAPNWLGDVVMFSSLIEFLHRNRQLPDGSKLVLGMAVRPSWKPLFENDIRLDFLISVLRPGRHAGILGGPRLGLEMRKFSPNAVILGPPSLRSGLAAFFSGANLRIGYEGDGRSALLTHSVENTVRGESHHSLELTHLGEMFFQALGWDEFADRDKNILPTLPACEEIKPSSTNSTSPIWIFAPGATYGSAKSWPLKPAVDFVRQVIDQRKVRLVVVGDEAASKYAAQLASNLSVEREEAIEGPPGLVDLTGKTDLNQVTALLKSCQVFVGNDSGLMHLSASLGVPTVGIFGSSNPDWTSPQGLRTKVVAAEGFDCRPCYLKVCNQKQFCLETIDSDQIMAAVDELLTSGDNTLQSK